MRQYEAVALAMEGNGGYATFAQLNRLALKIPAVNWGTRTPYASIRRIVQMKPDIFYRIRPGLLVEIGNARSFSTFVPMQDKNRDFLGRPLHKLATMTTMFDFTYPELVQRARMIDVCWFNERRMPDSLMEIEHTTDFQNSLLKFCALQDFRSKLSIVADNIRFAEYQKKLLQAGFVSIKNRVGFVSYEQVAELHTRECALQSVRQQVGF